MEREARGEEPSSESVNTVHDTPEAFDKWVRDHADKIKSSKSVPYFIRDNQQRVDRLLGEDDRAPKHGAIKHGRSSDKKFYEIKNDKILGKAAKLNKDIEKDAKEICQELGIKHKPMTLAEADNGSPNLSGDNNNCQSCVVVYEARRRGINLTALKYEENNAASRLGWNSGIAFVDSKGNTPKVHEIRGTEDEMVRQLKKAIENKGRYHLGKNTGNDGHIIVAEKLDDKTLILYDPQTNGTYTIEDFVKKSDYIEYLRVDKLKFNREILLAISRVVS